MKDYSNDGEVRECLQCNTILNRYNSGPYCHAHSNESYRVRHVPVTSCCGFQRIIYDKEHGLEGILPTPGTENYNDMAFNQEIEVADYDPDTGEWYF